MRVLQQLLSSFSAWCRGLQTFFKNGQIWSYKGGCGPAFSIPRYVNRGTVREYTATFVLIFISSTSRHDGTILSSAKPLSLQHRSIIGGKHTTQPEIKVAGHVKVPASRTLSTPVLFVSSWDTFSFVVRLTIATWHWQKCPYVLFYLRQPIVVFNGKQLHRLQESRSWNFVQRKYPLTATTWITSTFVIASARRGLKYGRYFMQTLPYH